MIYGYNGAQELLEVDVKHQLVMRKKLKYPPLNVKVLNWDGLP